MKNKKFWERARSRTIAVAMAVAVLAPTASWAGSKACRHFMGKGFYATVAKGMRVADLCHEAANAAGTASGACNNVSNGAFDPKGHYATAKAKANKQITGACNGAPVLASNFDPPATAASVESDIDTLIEDAIEGNSSLVWGIQDLAANPTMVQCLNTIGTARSAIVKEIVKNSTRCQVAKDKTGPLGALDPSCVNTGPTATGVANSAIPTACGASPTAGSDVGSCDPLPSCVVSSAQLVGQEIAAAIYQHKTPPPTCGDGIVNGSEQCDHGASNGTPGDTCNASCETLLGTCGPGTPAGGSVIGHRIITFNLNVPAGKQLAGVQVGFDYPQLEASIPGVGLTSVVQNAFLPLVSSPPDGFSALANDTDTDASFLIASADNFIGTGPLVQVTLDECVSITQNICSRNQNVIGCCPSTDIDACNASDSDPALCFCGAVGKINRSDCTTAAVQNVVSPPASCTSGLCGDPSMGGIPFAPANSCDDNASCTTAGAPNACCTGAGTGTCNKKCDAGSPNPGHACKAATEADDCSAATPVDQATCTADHHCAYIGDQANGTFGCLSVGNPPGAKIGQFDPVMTGFPFGGAPVGSCPTNNVCEKQSSLMKGSCTVSNPVDNLTRPVDGVTCSIDITEAP